MLSHSRDPIAQCSFDLFIIQSSRIVLKDKSERKTFFVIFQTFTAIFVERPATLQQTWDGRFDRLPQMRYQTLCGTIAPDHQGQIANDLGKLRGFAGFDNSRRQQRLEIEFEHNRGTSEIQRAC